MQPAQPHDENSKLDALVAQYLEAVERGEQPDRNQFLQQHPELATELQAFFADLDKVEAAKEKARPDLAATIIPQHEPKPGAIISGRYKLLENIGEGGMGSVWVAEQQQPVKRRVAIKLVKAGMDSKQVLARFEAERQALAVMDHPNIAKVFDGGMTEQGRPYFVMEYVKGVPFTEYCDKARLSVKERLNLFIPVCQAVQHAHHKGIVHRDLKPSNILICLYDGKPVPKVIDFGLAKAMYQSLTDQSIYTGHGIMVGTPLYMSPEQAEHNNLDVDTRTDIYSLGVVLYELLVGTTPLERDQLRKAAVDEVKRLIREVEPPRPSVRLSSSASLSSIAAQRSIDPRHLQKSLAGDLDWIVMKSLEKERTRRYETANGLARDIERFLNDEAVEACPPSRSYRLKKFIRKHRGQVIAASSVFLALLVGATGATWGWFRATEAEQTIRESLGEVKKERDAKTAALSEKSAALTAEAAQRILADNQRDLAERLLIEGMLRPIGYGDEPNTAELRSFVDWSAIPGARLKMRILEVAFDNPEVALRVARRADRAIQACVGLSPTRRARALELMSAKQRDMKADPRIRAAAAWLALGIGSTDLPALSEAIVWLSNLNSDGVRPRPESYAFIHFMSHRFAQLGPEQISRCGDLLIAILEKKGGDRFLVFAAENALSTLAARLSPDQISRGWRAVISDLKQLSPYLYAIEDYDAVENCIPALAAHLSLEEIRRAGELVLGAIEKNSENREFVLVALKHLEALAPKLSAEQIKRIRVALLSVLEKSSDETRLFVSGWNGLEKLTADLSPEQITHARNSLISCLEQTKNTSETEDVLNILAPLVDKLNPEQLGRTGDAIIGNLEKSRSRFDSDAMVKILVPLIDKLSPDQVARSWAALIDGMEDDTLSVSDETPPVLNSLATRLSPEQIARFWSTHIGVLANSTDALTLKAAVTGLEALAAKLNPEQVTISCIAVIGSLGELNDWGLYEAERNGLKTLAEKMSPEQCIHCGDALIQIVEQSTDPGTLHYAGSGLGALAEKLSAEQILRCGDALISVIEKTKDHNTPDGLFYGLNGLSEKLSPEQITRAGDVLLGILEQATDPSDLASARTALCWLKKKLSPGQISRTEVSLIAALKSTTDIGIAEGVFSQLMDFSEMQDREQTRQAEVAFINVLESATDRDAWRWNVERWVMHADRLSPHGRMQIADLLVRLDPVGDRGYEVARGIRQQFLKILTQLERGTQVRISAETMTILLDHQTSSERLSFDPSLSVLYEKNVDVSLNSFAAGVLAMMNAEALAPLLAHPGATGEPREWILQRFEELVFHDGKHVLLPLPESLGERQGNYEKPSSAIPAADGNEHGGLTPNRSPSVPPPRRFHNLHDAAAWIQENWPDFDLEATHPVVWRGER